MDTSELRTQLEKHHQESYGWALSCCSRDPLAAEGVLQAVYLKILEEKARFGGRASFKTWLFSVIRKTAVEKKRRQWFHELRRVQFDGLEKPSPKNARPDEVLYQSEIQTLFRQALAALPRRQREVLQLVFYHDLSLAEAAKVMSVSLGSVRTHYERGKRQLRQSVMKARMFDDFRFGREENPGIIPGTETGR